MHERQCKMDVSSVVLRHFPFLSVSDHFAFAFIPRQEDNWQSVSETDLLYLSLTSADFLNHEMKVVTMEECIFGPQLIPISMWKEITSGIVYSKETTGTEENDKRQP